MTLPGLWASLTNSILNSGQWVMSPLKWSVTWPVILSALALVVVSARTWLMPPFLKKALV